MILQYRAVSQIERVVLRGQGQLTIVQADEESLEVEAPASILRIIESRVEQHVLNLGHGGHEVPGLADYRATIRYRLKVRDLNSIVVTGNARVNIPDLDTDALSCLLIGRGRLRIRHLTADRFKADLRSRSRASIIGDVESQCLQLTDQAQYEADRLVSDFATIRLQESSRAHIRVNNELNATVGTKARLGYIGYPDLFKQGAGRVVRYRPHQERNNKETDHG